MLTKKRALSFMMAVIFALMSMPIGPLESYAENTTIGEAAFERGNDQVDKIEGSTMDAVELKTTAQAVGENIFSEGQTDSKADVLGSETVQTPSKVTVTFYHDIEDERGKVVTVEIPKGSKVTKPEDPVHILPGKVFVGWFEEDSGKYTPFDFEKAIDSDVRLYAQFRDAKIYTVTFQKGNQVLKKVEVEENKTIEPLAYAVDDPGMEFIGWKKKGTHELFDFKKGITENVVLLPKVGLKKIKVTFDYGYDNKKEEQQVAYGISAGRPEEAERAGYVFKGWFVGDKAFNFDNPITQEMTITAKWAKLYTVTFQKGNQVLKKVEVEENATIEPLAYAVDDPGVEFIGWKKKGTHDLFDFTQGIKENVVLLPKVSPKKIKVTFDYGYDNKKEEQQVAFGISAVRPEEAKRAGYVFKGWFVGDKAFNFDTSITEEMTITAKWAKLYTVTFQKGDQVLKKVEVEENATIEPLAYAVDEPGVEFIGWKKKGTHDLFDFKKGITENVVLLPKVSPKKFKVTFDYGYDNKKEEQQVAFGISAVRPKETERAGYVFKGWFVGDEAFNLDNPITQEMTLTAKWAKLYTVTFQKGNQVLKKVEVEENATIEPLAYAVDEPGVEFIGWKKQKTHDLFDFTQGIKENVVLLPKVSPKKIKVTFDYGYDNKKEEQQVAFGISAVRPKETERAGYVFKGWFVGDEAFNLDNPITQEMTLTAKWVKLHKMTYKRGSQSRVVAVEDGTIAQPLLFKMELEEYEIFLGWIESGKSELFDFSSPIHRDVQLRAKIGIKKFKVTFDYGYDNKQEEQQVEYGKNAKQPEKTERAGYVFKGWFAGDEAFNLDNPITKEMTLTAKWEVVPAVNPPSSGGGGGGGGGGGFFSSSSSNNETTITDNTVPLASAQKEMFAQFVIGSLEYKVKENSDFVSKMMDMAPRIHEGRTMLPVRITGSILDVKADYDSKTKTAKFYYQGKDSKVNVVEMTIGKNTMKVNGETRSLTTNVIAVKGRMMLPISDLQKTLRDLGLGVDIQWDGLLKQVSLYK